MDLNQAENAASAPAQAETAEQATVNAVSAESAPAPTAEAHGEGQTQEKQGSAPDEQSKLVRELIATRKRAQQAEKEAAYLRGLAEASKPQQPQPAAADGIPKAESYETYDEYNAALVQYHARKIAREEADRILREQHERRELASLEEKKKGFQAKLRDVENASPDLYDAIINMPIAAHNTKVLLELENGVEVAKKLAIDGELLKKINSLPAEQAILEIGKLSVKVEMGKKPEEQKTNKVSKAPEPIKPATGQGGNAVIKPLHEMTPEEFAAYRNKQRGYL